MAALPKRNDSFYATEMGRLASCIFALAFSLQLTPLPVHANCGQWFQDGKLKKGKDCLIKCASLPVDMGTFDCPNSCDDFCGSAAKERFLFQLSDLYPGLTAAEKALVSQHPRQMLKAYQLAQKAEELCLKEFPRSDTNDESDACRHFVWAVFLSKELGTELSQKILDAHEQEPTQPEEEKAMDLANNQRGVSFANSRAGALTDRMILDEFRKLQSEGKLIILRKLQKK